MKSCLIAYVNQSLLFFRGQAFLLSSDINKNRCRMAAVKRMLLRERYYLDTAFPVACAFSSFLSCMAATMEKATVAPAIRINSQPPNDREALVPSNPLEKDEITLIMINQSSVNPEAASGA